MERRESAAWPLAGGALCVFVLTVVLKDTAWQVGFAAAAASVAGWSLMAPPEVGAALGAVAWALVTGFDVNSAGELVLTGVPDAVRAAVLVGVGLAAAAAGRWFAGPAGSRDAEEPLVPPEEFAWPPPGSGTPAGVLSGRRTAGAASRFKDRGRGMPSQDHVAQASPRGAGGAAGRSRISRHPTKEKDHEWSGVRPADGGGVRPARPAGEGRGETVTAENLIGLALAVLLIVFLAAALLFPERF
jgi:hypothetical protein